jgi:hypothetical protein
MRVARSRTEAIHSVGQGERSCPGRRTSRTTGGVNRARRWSGLRRRMPWGTRRRLFRPAWDNDPGVPDAVRCWRRR